MEGASFRAAALFGFSGSAQLRLLLGLMRPLIGNHERRVRSRKITKSSSRMNGKLSILREFWDFLRVRKKWWLAPVITLLLVLGLILVVTEGSAIAPFIYSLF